jgi:hypothetical protein
MFMLQTQAEDVAATIRELVEQCGAVQDDKVTEVTLIVVIMMIWITWNYRSERSSGSGRGQRAKRHGWLRA